MKRAFHAVAAFSIFSGFIAFDASALENRLSPAAGKENYAVLFQQMQTMQEEMRIMAGRHAEEITRLHAELTALKAGRHEELAASPPGEATPVSVNDEESLYRTIKENIGQSVSEKSVANGLNLDAAVVVDGFFYHDDSDAGMAEIKENIAGFGHSHGDDGHHHAETENGFNLRHVEVGLSAEVDPYFRAWTTLAFDDESSELEEAVLQSTSLPGGLTVSGGKFFSGIGRLNRQHSHSWDFSDQPLVYELMFGEHNLLEKGVQLTWLAPTPFYLLFGSESLNGDNEKMFQQVDADALPDHDAPRLWTGFVKFGPDLGARHAVQFGLSCAMGSHQEEHDGDEDGTYDHWLNGHSRLLGADFVYKYAGYGEHGRGDIVLQAEYLNRDKDLRVKQHDLVPALAGNDKQEKQDGYYVQALYGFLPRWRAGLRWEEAGLTNDVEYPDSTDESYGASNRLSAMLDWKLSEFSLLRLQTAYGDYEMDDGDEEAWEVILQWQLTFGKHAAHDF